MLAYFGHRIDQAGGKLDGDRYPSMEVRQSRRLRATMGTTIQKVCAVEPESHSTAYIRDSYDQSPPSSGDVTGSYALPLCSSESRMFPFKHRVMKSLR
jgi:hypothetical protein